MPGNFQPGTWIQMPGNCTQSFFLTYSRCFRYGYFVLIECLNYTVSTLKKCLSWVWQAVQTCVGWAQNVTKNCCTWIPCSWACDAFVLIVATVCIAFAIVVSAVCLVLAILVILVCGAYALVTAFWCIVWSFFTFLLCLSYMDGGTAFLLTDGTVMMQEGVSLFGESWGTNRWWKLTPDEFGSYANGQWSQLADSNLGRSSYASSVLADGRVLVCGGEYTAVEGGIPEQTDDNTCEIYDPVANTWSVVASPIDPDTQAPWGKIGDAPCTVLDDGTFMMGCVNKQLVALFDPATMQWRDLSIRPRGSSAEESWVLTPFRQVISLSCVQPGVAWVYSYGIALDSWQSSVVQLTKIVSSPPGEVAEIGPGLLLYDGTAFYVGANKHTAIFNQANPIPWTNGPDLPAVNGADLGVLDGPAALLVNGNVLVGAAPTSDPPDYLSPCYYFEYDGTSFNRTSDPPNNDVRTEDTRLLLLPNGDILFARTDDSTFYAYHSDAAAPQDGFRPIIQACPATIESGTTIQVSGMQFNGLSQAVAYGDDCQNPTNYPLVRIVNKQSGHVKYCRTFNHTTVDPQRGLISFMGVAAPATVVTTNVAIPTDMEAGDSSLFVVANGIPSQPFNVTVVLLSQGRTIPQ